MLPTLMSLKILLPTGIFVEQQDVVRLVVETEIGFFGFLPHRLDCISALVPGILTYENNAQGEKFVAIDKGVLIKTGTNVIISVRKAIAGKSLELLRQAVEEEFKKLDEQEQIVRKTMAKMESSFIHHLAEMKNE